MKAPSGVYPGEGIGTIGLPRERNVAFVATGEFRPPKRGEYYLSGAIIEAYRAPNDFTQAYWIARKVTLVECQRCKGTGKVVQDGPR